MSDDMLESAKRWVAEVEAAYADGGYAAGDNPNPPLDGMQALIGEVEQLQAIVRDLANLASPLDDEDGACLLCGSMPDYPYEDHVSDHDSSCPWRRAVEWIERHPSEETAT